MEEWTNGPNEWTNEWTNGPNERTNERTNERLKLAPAPPSFPRVAPRTPSLRREAGSFARPPACTSCRSLVGARTRGDGTGGPRAARKRSPFEQ